MRQRWRRHVELPGAVVFLSLVGPESLASATVSGWELSGGFHTETVRRAELAEQGRVTQEPNWPRAADNLHV